MPKPKPDIEIRFSAGTIELTAGSSDEMTVKAVLLPWEAETLLDQLYEKLEEEK